MAVYEFYNFKMSPAFSENENNEDDDHPQYNVTELYY